MPDFPLVMRGLAIPDPNFLWPMGDKWTLTSANGCTITSIHPDNDDVVCAGRGINVDIGSGSAHGSDYIESGFTPFGVAAGPCLASTEKLNFWFGIIAKCDGVTDGNDATLVKVWVDGYDTNGIPSPIVAVDEFEDGDGVAFNNSGSAHETYQLFSCAKQSGGIDTTIRYFKMFLGFTDSTEADLDPDVQIVWAGAAIMFDTTATPDIAAERLANWYDPAASFASLVDRGRLPRNANAGARVAHKQIVSLQFPQLSEADKEKIRECYYWNKGTPTDDVSMSSDGNALNRGTEQPIVAVLNREGVKRAFYADMSFGYSQASRGWWPDTGAIWSAPITFEEWVDD